MTKIYRLEVQLEWDENHFVHEHFQDLLKEFLKHNKFNGLQKFKIKLFDEEQQLISSSVS